MDKESHNHPYGLCSAMSVDIIGFHCMSVYLSYNLVLTSIFFFSQPFLIQPITSVIPHAIGEKNVDAMENHKDILKANNCAVCKKLCYFNSSRNRQCL